MTTMEDLTIYEKAMTTGRSAEKLARKHGFKSIGQVAEFLPDDAMVLDVGAGASPFGSAVASLRPDITWINYDFSYYEPQILEEVRQAAPANVEYMPGDATYLDKEFDADTFDASFSYWMFPHLSLENIEPARLAARAIFNVTKPEGLISVGPEMSQSRLPSLKIQKAMRFIKDGSQDADGFADMVAEKTSVRGYTRYIERLSNEVMTTYLGTSRYFKPGDHIGGLMYDPQKGEYVNAMSLRGAQLWGGMTLAAVRYVQQTLKNSPDTNA